MKPDPFFPKYIGNILEDSFTKIWNNKKIQFSIILENFHEKLVEIVKVVSILVFAMVEVEVERMLFMMICGQKTQVVISSS